MDPRAFYRFLWSTKTKGDHHCARGRDWFHRFFLDPIFDPRANPRHDIAVSLLQGGGSLLDIGCWSGYLLECIRDAGLYNSLFGVDVVAEAIETVRAKGFQAQVVDLNREPLPFRDACFDGVTMLAVLEHVFDPYTVIREVHRVLRPGGEMVMSVPNVASFTNRMRIVFGRLPVTSRDAGWDGGHLHYFTKRALDQLLTLEGFQIWTRRVSGGRPRLREWWLSLLGGEFIYYCLRRWDLREPPLLQSKSCDVCGPV